MRPVSGTKPSNLGGCTADAFSKSHPALDKLMDRYSHLGRLSALTKLNFRLGAENIYHWLCLAKASSNRILPTICKTQGAHSNLLSC